MATVLRPALLTRIAALSALAALAPATSGNLLENTLSIPAGIPKVRQSFDNPVRIIPPAHEVGRRSHALINTPATLPKILSALPNNPVLARSVQQPDIQEALALVYTLPPLLQGRSLDNQVRARSTQQNDYQDALALVYTLPSALQGRYTDAPVRRLSVPQFDSQLPVALYSVQAAPLIPSDTFTRFTLPMRQYDAGTQSLALTTVAPDATPAASDGGRRRRHRDDIERERKMVEEYLAALEKKNALVAAHAPARVIKRAEAVRPKLTEAVARAATDIEIQRVLREAADARDRAIAEGERRRRYVASFIVLTLH